MRSDGTHPLHLLAGPALWFVWFMAVYGGLSVGCAVAPPEDEGSPLTLINAVLAMLTLGLTMLLLWAASHCWHTAHAGGDERAEHRFIGRVSVASYALAAGATLAVGTPILLLPPCI